MKNHAYGLGTALAAILALTGPQALASSHREAPNITKMPKVDATDLYAFQAYEPNLAGFTTLIANYIPFQDPFGGPNYYTMDPDAIYEIHIDNTGTGVEDLTYQFKFTNSLHNGTGQTLTVGGKTLPIALRQDGTVTTKPSPNLGEIENFTLTLITGPARTGTATPITDAVTGSTTFTKPLDNIGFKTTPSYNAYLDSFNYNIKIPGCTKLGKVFVGQREEAFAINLGESFDLVNYIPIEGDSAPFAHDGKGFPGGITQSRTNDDLVGKKNVTSLELQIPTQCLTGAGNGVIGVWTTASLPQARLLSPNPTYLQPDVQSGAYVQVSRLGMPLTNELVVGLPDKDAWNASQPSGDGYFLPYVTNPTFPAILNILFLNPVNATLGTKFANLAPSNFPRNDLVATFLTGIQRTQSAQNSDPVRNASPQHRSAADASGHAADVRRGGR